MRTKKEFFNYGCFVVALMIAVACKRQQNFVYQQFTTPQEAVDVCDNFFDFLQNNPQEWTVERMAATILTWEELQDSAIACFDSDSVGEKSDETINAFYVISDSIRNRITTIVNNEKLTFRDVIWLKINTNPRRKTTRQEPATQIAQAFFTDNDIYGDKDIALEKYHECLQMYTRDGFVTEKDVREFFKREDKCFRSIMPYLLTLEQDELEILTDKTDLIMSRLCQDISSMNDEECRQRIVALLTVRFNRRLLQNATQCQKDIHNSCDLSIAGASYKWMLLQPFMTIDDYAIEVMTEEQESSLLNLAEELPQSLIYISHFNLTEPAVTEESAFKILEVLGDYILNSHLKTIL